MKKDPILEELRRYRHDIEVETNHDPKQYHAYLLRMQEQYKDRIASCVSHTSSTSSSNTNG